MSSLAGCLAGCGEAALAGLASGFSASDLSVDDYEDPPVVLKQTHKTCRYSPRPTSPVYNFRTESDLRLAKYVEDCAAACRYSDNNAQPLPDAANETLAYFGQLCNTAEKKGSSIDSQFSQK